MSTDIWASAYQVCGILKAEGFQITEKTLSIWKSGDRIKKDESGQINLNEVRNILIDKLKARGKEVPDWKDGFNKYLDKNDRAKKKLAKNEKNQIETNPNVTYRQQIEKNTDMSGSERDNRANLLLLKLKGDARKSFLASKKAKIELDITRGKLLDRDVLTLYINATISAHNNRVLNVPSKLADWCISITRANDDDSEARVKLIEKFNKELSDILSSEKKEIANYMRKRNNE